MPRALMLLPLLFLGCDTAAEGCTEIGCVNSLTLTFVDADGNEVTGLVGSVTLAYQTFHVDCVLGRNSDAQITCDGGTMSVNVQRVDESSRLSFDLANEDGVTVGAQDVDPGWTISRPNGEDCPPTCGTADVTVPVDGA